MTAAIDFVLTVHTTNPLNGGSGTTRQAAIIRSRQRASHRNVAWLRTLNAMVAAGVAATELVPCVVTLTRLSAGTMDTDGLAASQKGVRDGIADALRIDDGSRFVTWVYRQEKGPQKKHAVRVHIERRPA